MRRTVQRELTETQRHAILARVYDYILTLPVTSKQDTPPANEPLAGTVAGEVASVDHEGQHHEQEYTVSEPPQH